jgi:ATP-dependent RNA helicase SUPV3L1/SUV3
MKNLSKIEKRIAEKRRTAGALGVVQYVLGLPQTWIPRLLPLLHCQEAGAVTARLQGRAWRRAIDAKRLQAAQAAAAARARGERQRALDAARASSNPARSAAALPYTQAELRPLLSCEERAQVATLRAEEITRAGVCRLLGCTAAEFNRWYEGGRLPLFRTKRLQSQKAARSFLRSEVAALAAHVALWRAQDAIRQVRRRHGLRSV